MYELIQTGQQSFYINSPAKIGIYLKAPGEIYLIDSGNDKEAGRKILKIIKEQNWQLRGIINTHSNADHIGGNRYLQQQTGCPIFTGGIETAFIQHPILEPAFLYGGYPCKDLRHKFLMAAESETTDIGDPSFPQELEIIPLPGHFFHMIGLRLPDDTVFLADCISSRETLEKYKLSFIYDVSQYLNTLDMAEKMEAALFVPSHADPGPDLKELIQFNRRTVLEIADKITELCHSPITWEELLQMIFREYSLSMNFEQYVLIGSTLRSYLSWLKDTGKITVEIQDNKLLWKQL